MSYIRGLARIDAPNYPESLAQMHIVNAPLIFSGAWRVISGFLDPITRAKVTVHGTNFLAKVTEDVAEDVLPQFLGGTRFVAGKEHSGVLSSRNYTSEHHRDFDNFLLANGAFAVALDPPPNPLSQPSAQKKTPCRSRRRPPKPRRCETTAPSRPRAAPRRSWRCAWSSWPPCRPQPGASASSASFCCSLWPWRCRSR
jgi:hypothetical protein